MAYFLLVDPVERSVFLVHHAGLWLPTGGHVEVGEDPADTVRREAPEEGSRSRSEPLRIDDREFVAARWWSRDQVEAADPRMLEPHLPRFLAKRARLA